MVFLRIWRPDLAEMSFELLKELKKMEFVVKMEDTMISELEYTLEIEVTG